MGLDYHYDFSERSVQRDMFARQLDLAARLDLPAIIHCREAEDDLASLLRAHFARSRRQHIGDEMRLRLVIFPQVLRCSRCIEIS